MEMAFEKTLWMNVDSDLEQLYLHLDEHKIYRVSSYIYHGFSVNDKGLADDAIGFNIMKELSIKTPTKLFETFVEPVILYYSSTIVNCKVDDNKLKAAQNTARWMMLGPYSRRQMSVKELVEKVPLKNLAAQLQKRRLDLWVSPHKTAIQSLNSY